MKRPQLPKYIVDADPYLAIASIVLVIIGILSIYSAGVDSAGRITSDEYVKQIIWALSGFFLAFLVMMLDISRLKDYAIFGYIFILVVLLFTRFAGRVVNGARSWIGFSNFGIQPSEFAKLFTILYLSKYLDSSEQSSDFKRLVIGSVIVGLPVLLILSQPDFGSALVFFPILLFMLFAANLDRRYVLFLVLTIVFTFFLLIFPLADKFFPTKNNLFSLFIEHGVYVMLFTGFCILAAILAGWGWLKFKKRYYFWISYIFSILDISFLISYLARKVLKEYQVMRLMVFLNPNIDPQGSGWNIIQSMTAIGSGGFGGKGYLQGVQSHARYIPQQSTDFIFSIIAEEWGFVGSFVLFFLFFLLFYRSISIMETTKDKFSYLVVSGILGMFVFHFMINAGMAMGIMPITGIPLYFISYGGSSLWVALLSIGLLLGISARRYRM
jgi:rod shape determining protein RodA